MRQWCWKVWPCAWHGLDAKEYSLLWGWRHPLVQMGQEELLLPLPSWLTQLSSWFFSSLLLCRLIASKASILLLSMCSVTWQDPSFWCQFGPVWFLTADRMLVNVTVSVLEKACTLQLAISSLPLWSYRDHSQRSCWSIRRARLPKLSLFWTSSLPADIRLCESARQDQQTCLVRHRLVSKSLCLLFEAIEFQRCLLHSIYCGINSWYTSHQCIRWYISHLSKLDSNSHSPRKHSQDYYMEIVFLLKGPFCSYRRQSLLVFAAVFARSKLCKDQSSVWLPSVASLPSTGLNKGKTGEDVGWWMSMFLRFESICQGSLLHSSQQSGLERGSLGLVSACISKSGQQESPHPVG